MHLDESPLRLLRFRAVLAQVADLAGVDALLSGDLADHGDTGEYEQLFSVLPTLITTTMVGLARNRSSTPIRGFPAQMVRRSSPRTTLPSRLAITSRHRVHHAAGKQDRPDR